ncbi:hypothetical protein R1flu_019980 [Riccia fluitans]|uniref:Transmembrane protein 53 n=1 Tax=Riccia fluitans TaxID=41844 RepID=A0ABD1ZKL9_9MARC
MMATASAARLPGVMAGAAALATAVTSADFPHKLQPKTPSTVFHVPHPLPSSACSVSSCETISHGSANTCYASSLPLAREVSCSANPLSIPTPKVLSQIFPFHISQSSSVVSPSYVNLPRDVLHKHFSGQTSKFLPVSAQYVSPSPHSSSAFFSPSFDFSAHFASLGLPHSSVPLPSTGAWNAIHSWHTPAPGSFSNTNGKPGSSKPAVTVVLLGWLGSQQKHLKKYADWYNARGIHAVTFTVPIADILSFTMSGKAEAHVDELATHLAMWLDEEQHGDKHLIFHTFSNTGWLTYGVVLEKLQARGTQLINKIKGCVIDSAPSADPDPQVWASGFSAALLKKRSVAAQAAIGDGREKLAGVSQPHIAEAALLLMLEKFFTVFLQIPAINERLSHVVNILSKQQPNCPQLYIYSTADKVIPAKSVESFIEQQRRSGRIVRACNLHSSPHVDHFRSFPDIYGKQVSSFLQECSPKYVR